jgi:glucokinase
MGVANMISLLNPEKVLIGGEIADYLPFVLGQIQDKVSRITPIRAAVEAARAGTEAGVLGVIAFAFEQERNSM